MKVASRRAECDDWDVLLEVEIKWWLQWREKDEVAWRDNYRVDGKRISVELKPQLGDDYPAVLRKMLRRIGCSRPSRLYDGRTIVAMSCGATPVLVVGSFNSDVTSLSDLKEIFAQSDIKVVTMSEIEETA